MLDTERRDGRAKRLHALPMPLDRLPDGTMVQAGEGSFVLRGGKALRWSFDGYSETNDAPVTPLLITPPSTLGALLAGYRPVLHASAATPGTA